MIRVIHRLRAVECMMWAGRKCLVMILSQIAVFSLVISGILPTNGRRRLLRSHDLAGVILSIEDYQLLAHLVPMPITTALNANPGYIYSSRCCFHSSFVCSYSVNSTDHGTSRPQDAISCLQLCNMRLNEHRKLVKRNPQHNLCI